MPSMVARRPSRIKAQPAMSLTWRS
jgi:hypothetical protein